MRQRLGIARCLLADPKLVILDEPMNGLDPGGILELRGLIAGLVAEGRTVFVSSHLLDEIEKTCHAAAVIDRGRLIAQGPISELIGDTRTRYELTCDNPRAALGTAGRRTRPWSRRARPRAASGSPWPIPGRPASSPASSSRPASPCPASRPVRTSLAGPLPGPHLPGRRQLVNRAIARQMIAADILKLRRHRPTMATAALLSVGIALLYFAVHRGPAPRQPRRPPGPVRRRVADGNVLRRRSPRS